VIEKLATVYPVQLICTVLDFRAAVTTTSRTHEMTKR